jgi:hypothetical protein
VFFDTLGIKWWYEPEGFSLRFDYEDFAFYWDMTEDELLQAGVPQTFKHLDGKEYAYLPDFYLPELDYWLEIKGPNPTREEIEKAFMLSWMVLSASIQKSKEAFVEALEEAMAEGKSDEAITEALSPTDEDDMIRQGVFIIYGDVPWPFPQKGNIFGYSKMYYSGSEFLETLAHREARLVSAESSLTRVESVAEESPRKEPEYRSLLKGQLKLCWQECPLCLKIGIGRIGSPYCRSCHDQVAYHLWGHIAGYRATNNGEPRLAYDSPFPPKGKGMKLTKGLMNPEFFTSGHRSPKLQEAYSAARSARFEHGQSS